MFRFFQTMSLVLLSVSPLSAEIVHEVFYRLPEGDAIDMKLLVDPGMTLDATIVFRESVTGATNPIVGATGLGGVGIRMTATGGDGRLTILERPNFQIPSTVNDATTIAGASPFGGIVSITSPLEGVFEAVIGQVQLMAPTVPGEETVFSFVDPQPTADNFSGLGPGTTLNESAFRLGTLSVTAVPEPGSLMALSVLGLGGIVWHRRRSAAKRTAAMA